MGKEKLLTITLFVSVLVFNPSLAQSVEPINNTQRQHTTTITEDIADILYKRGLEEDVAKKLSETFVADDEILIEMMIENVLQACEGIKKEEVLRYLSNEALFRKKVALHRYDDLMKMVFQIKQNAFKKSNLKNLHAVAKKNSLLMT